MRTAVINSALMVVVGLTCCWGQLDITIDGDISDITAKTDAWVYYDTDSGETDRYGYDITKVVLWRYFYDDGGTPKCDMYVGIEVSGTPGDADGDGDPDNDDPGASYPNTDFESIGTKFFGTIPNKALSEYVIVEFWADSGSYGCGVDFKTNWYSDGSDPTAPYESKGYAVGSASSGIITDDASAPYTDFDMASSAGSDKGYEMVFRDFHSSVTGDFTFYVETNAASGPEDWMWDTPTAVTLASAEGQLADGAKRLLWETGAEAGLVGFNVWAASSKLGPYNKLNRRLLPVTGEGGVSGTYRYLDQTPAFARHQYYKIELMGEDGRGELSDPIEISSPDEPRAMLMPPRE